MFLLAYLISTLLATPAILHLSLFLSVTPKFPNPALKLLPPPFFSDPQVMWFFFLIDGRERDRQTDRQKLLHWLLLCRLDPFLSRIQPTNHGTLRQCSNQLTHLARIQVICLYLSSPSATSAAADYDVLSSLGF